jgi:hypothetical protein
MEVLQALEFTPRFRQAQRLLVQIHEQRKRATAIPTINRPDPGKPPRP